MAIVGILGLARKNVTECSKRGKAWQITDHSYNIPKMC